MTAPVPPSADRIEKAALRDALRIHHPIMRSETGPFSGCRCGGVNLGQDVIAHVVERLAAATARRPVQWTGTDESFAAIEALGLPGLRRYSTNTLEFHDGDGVHFAYPRDWLIPEPVTSWRVSTGPNEQEPGADEPCVCDTGFTCLAEDHVADAGAP